MSVENGKVCCNCRHCKRIQKKIIECRCDRDDAYLTAVTVLTYWCRHWAKEREAAQNDT